MYRRMIAVSFKIPDEHHDELKIAALELKTTKSAILRALVESFVKHRKMKPKPYTGRGIVIW